MTKITVRRAEARDMEALATLVAALAAHHGDTAGTSAALLRRDIMGNDPWVTVWVAAVGARLVGYAACQRRVQMQSGKRGLDLHHLFVAAERRGQGVGRALVARARDWAQGEGCAVLLVGTRPDNSRAQAFYLGLGFQQVAVDATRFALPIEAR